MALKGDRKVNPITFKTVIDKYIKDCTTNNKRPLKSEVAYLLGIDKDTLTNYRLDKRYNEPIKRIELLSETYLNRRLDDTSSNPNAIFGLKAQHGYIETSKVDVTTNGQTLGVVQLPQKGA